MTDTQIAEQDFYSRYSWCLNGPLSVEELLRRLQEELDHYETLSGWQREESKANLYLFVCAIACTADDYLALPWINLRPISTRVPKLRGLLAPLQSVADWVQAAFKINDLAAFRWRQRWTKCVEDACTLLLSDSRSEAARFSRLLITATDLMSTHLPQSLLKRHMRLPEAFRAQDMSHHDVIRLIRAFTASVEPGPEPILIMGLRTAGAYFAPLMAEYLKSQGFTNVTWVSIRPKNGVSRPEKHQLRNAARHNRRLLLVDDYPSTGHTFRLTLDILHEHGVRDEQIAVLAPTHEAQRNWPRLAGLQDPIRVFTIQPDELYKVDVLAPAAIERLCNEYYEASGYKARVMEDPQIEAINRRLAEHLKDGHHAREKRVFSVELQHSGGAREIRKIFFKSVGWGWLGYHAYIAGTRLEGFVPKVVGLRDGLLITEWIEEKNHDVPVPVERIASYVAARSRKLTLAGNCRLESSTYRWTGYDHILSVLRQAYGPYVNRLKMRALRRNLEKYVSSVPALVDGRMQPGEWLNDGRKFYKIDFEHHNFGGGEADIVDPAYDLAAAAFEFGLSRDAEQELLRVYVKESGDSTVNERIVFHKILYGSMAIDYTTQALAAGKDPYRNNERRLQARNFLVYAMTEFCARFIQPETPRPWSPALFFMDIDGVFDYEMMGFPHATRCGLQSISLLVSHGFSIVPNTGRGVQHVRQYCSAYGFPGGIAEYGSVFIDTVNRREIPFITPDTVGQLAVCRKAIQELPGVFIDPSYEYSIRAFRYNGRIMEGLTVEEVKSVLKRPEFSRLTFICRPSSTYIVQKRLNKGTALRAVRRMVGKRNVPVTAIGDSELDISMLRSAEFAYAPANCASLVRKLAKEGKCRIVRQRFQSGLLAAVEHRLRCEHTQGSRDFGVPASILENPRGLMETLLSAADRGAALQILIALMWWST
jgi:hydroxymethylpyrimidine pyrophosphatase-like HAD family hydrolase/orotate phosphoribosyltransferase